ncbi:MAG TPA: hypothetical protein VJ824_03065 [Bacillota bacterium]|nr:hypothetical protein [Bacillota bacterium]
MRVHGLLRFVIIASLCTTLRFYLGQHSPNFLWFFILYLPMVNWGIYWLMSVIRIGINQLAGEGSLSEHRIRRIYVWYLNVPGSLALAELIYRGYLYNT